MNLAIILLKFLQNHIRFYTIHFVKPLWLLINCGRILVRFALASLPTYSLSLTLRANCMERRLQIGLCLTTNIFLPPKGCFPVIGEISSSDVFLLKINHCCLQRWFWHQIYSVKTVCERVSEMTGKPLQNQSQHFRVSLKS